MELAVLFKKRVDINKNIELMPIKVIEGVYVEQDGCFLDKEGTPYYHIIENPDSYGYGYRSNIKDYKEQYKHLSLSLVKMLLLRTIKKCVYTYNTDSDTNAPVILFADKMEGSEATILFDDEIGKFYMEKHSDFYNMYFNKEEVKEEDVKENIDIKKLYHDLTTYIVGQDDAIKKLLITMWKQSLGDKNINKNIILDGPSGVGKSKLCKLLTKMLNIPCVTISASGGKMKNSDYIIFELLKKTNFDVEKAQKGIVLIDKFDDLIKYSSPEGESELERLLDKEELVVSSTIGEFVFDTSNLVVLGLGDLQNNIKGSKQSIGFNSQNVENKKSCLFEKFSSYIKMNKLDYDNFLKILNSDKGLLRSNIDFLSNQGVSVKLDNAVINEMAFIASNSNNGVKSLEEIIERTLSVAEFEIASNPDLYSELIITSETIRNNSAYTLVKKKN